ncbi:MAG: hypothetical protein IPM16_20375 [Chloroflexi bacterium]|nr:hypothetical protein [Chloroflexota bacterium]
MATSATSGNNVIAVLAAIYTIILCIIQICGGVVIGLLSGGLGAIGRAATEAGVEDPSLTELGNATGATGIVSIILVVVGIALLAASVGVFMRRPWSYWLMIAMHVAFVVLTLLSAGLSNIVSIIFMVLSAGVAAAFFLMPDIKRALNVA